jgi:hypothetical protein
MSGSSNPDPILIGDLSPGQSEPILRAAQVALGALNFGSKIRTSASASMDGNCSGGLVSFSFVIRQGFAWFASLHGGVAACGLTACRVMSSTSSNLSMRIISFCDSDFISASARRLTSKSNSLRTRSLMS